MRLLNSGAHFRPSGTSERITSIRFRAPKEFCPLGLSDWRFGRIGGETVPERNSQLNTLSRRQVREVEQWVSHIGNVLSREAEINMKLE